MICYAIKEFRWCYRTFSHLKTPNSKLAFTFIRNLGHCFLEHLILHFWLAQFILILFVLIVEWYTKVWQHCFQHTSQNATLMIAWCLWLSDLLNLQKLITLFAKNFQSTLLIWSFLPEGLSGQDICQVLSCRVKLTHLKGHHETVTVNIMAKMFY